MEATSKDKEEEAARKAEEASKKKAFGCKAPTRM